MKHRIPTFSIALLAIIFFGVGCKKNEGVPRNKTLVTSILADANFLNPVIASTYETALITEQLYPTMLITDFDTTKGFLDFRVDEGSLAESYSISEDSRSITYKIRQTSGWNDGTQITSADIRFTYELYGDTAVKSLRQQFLSDLVRKESGEIDYEKAIETPDSKTVTFHFAKPLPKNLLFFRSNLPPIPKHVWEKVERSTMRQSPFNQNPVTARWYKLEKWVRNDELSLIPDQANTNGPIGTLDRVVFRVIPDYTARLTQIQTGDLDILETLKPEDIKPLLEKNPNIEIKTVPPRAIDHITYPALDLEEYQKGKVVPHPIFGSKKVRQAFTLAIDRQSIIEGYLGPYGIIANSDFSPIFKWAYNKDITPHPYDPKEAARLLDEEGWRIGTDGIRVKKGIKMKIKLYLNSGNARRAYACNTVQENWKSIGVDCELVEVESNTFFSELMNRKYNHPVFAGTAVGLEIDPRDTWSSDFKKSRFNWAGYQISRLDTLMQLASNEPNPENAAKYWREFQEILHDEQPRTFMYWVLQTHAFSKNILNSEVSVTTTYEKMYRWKMNAGGSLSTASYFTAE